MSGTSVRPRSMKPRIGYTNQMNFSSDPSIGKRWRFLNLGWQFGKVDDFRGLRPPAANPYSWLTPGTNAIYKEHVFDYSDVVTHDPRQVIPSLRWGELLAYRG